MIDYIKLIGNAIIIDVDKLYCTQRVIFNKWRVELPDSPMQNINNYTLHTIEELYESENAPGPVEKLEETIDALMYLMSSISAYLLDDKFTKPEFDVMVITEDKLKKEVPTIQDIICKMMDVRRMFPERKWHKPYNPDDIDYRMRSKLTLNAYKEMMVMIIKRMYIDFDIEDTYYINEKLNSKQSFVKNLDDDNTEVKVEEAKEVKVEKDEKPSGFQFTKKIDSNNTKKK